MEVLAVYIRELEVCFPLFLPCTVAIMTWLPNRMPSAGVHNSFRKFEDKVLSRTDELASNNYNTLQSHNLAKMIKSMVGVEGSICFV